MIDLIFAKDHQYNLFVIVIHQLGKYFAERAVNLVIVGEAWNPVKIIGPDFGARYINMNVQNKKELEKIVVKLVICAFDI